jgi:ribosomal protein L18E
MIDRNFGRNKFRELGEHSANLESFVEFVDSLASLRKARFGKKVVNFLKNIARKKPKVA